MGAPASLRKPAVVLGSIKEKSALTRVPGHSTGDMLLAGAVGAAYVAACFRARRGGVHTVNYVSIRLDHGVPRCLLNDRTCLDEMNV